MKLILEECRNQSVSLIWAKLIKGTRTELVEIIKPLADETQVSPKLILDQLLHIRSLCVESPVGRIYRLRLEDKM